jgi:hypothetical protein
MMSTLDPASKGNVVGMIRQLTIYFLNIIDVNSTIQVHRVLWSCFYHTGSLLKKYKNEFYFVRWLKNFRHYNVFYKKNTRMYDVRCPPW